MKSVVNLICFTLLLFCVACSDDDEPSTNDLENPASGIIGGVDWQFDLGTAFFEEIDNKYTINLLGIAEGADNDGCNIIFPGEEYVRFTVDAEVGRTDIPFEFSAQGVKFYPDRSVGGFELATDGYVEITAITDNQVTGVLDATLDSNNQVSGSFVVTICQ